MRLARRAFQFFVLFILLFVFISPRAQASSSAELASSPSNDLRGVEWGNFKWLDPFGVFPNKPSVRPGISDKDLFEEMLEKIELSRAKSVKIVLSTYATETYPKFWREAQRRVIDGIHERFPSLAFIFLLEPLYYLDNDPAITLANTPTMARDFSAVINQITRDVQDQDGSPPIWIIIGNEPNFSGEGFLADPDYFNAWFEAVVWNFWNRYPIKNNKGASHAIFYPGLAFNLDPMRWYQAESTKEVLRNWVNGVSIHAYWNTGNEKNAASGEIYKTLWRDGVAPVNPNLSVIVGEWGNYNSTDDMDSVKAHEYVRWLAELMEQKEVPVIASSGFILDGTDEWRSFRWTKNTAREIGVMNVP